MHRPPSEFAERGPHEVGLRSFVMPDPCGPGRELLEEPAEQLVSEWHESVSPETKRRVLFYLAVGSQNQKKSRR